MACLHSFEGGRTTASVSTCEHRCSQKEMMMGQLEVAADVEGKDAAVANVVAAAVVVVAAGEESG